MNVPVRHLQLVFLIALASLSSALVVETRDEEVNNGPKIRWMLRHNQQRFDNALHNLQVDACGKQYRLTEQLWGRTDYQAQALEEGTAEPLVSIQFVLHTDAAEPKIAQNIVGLYNHRGSN